MRRNIYSYRAPKAGITFVILMVAIGIITLQPDTEARETKSYNAYHTITHPKVKPKQTNNCNVEAIAYASALAALHDARRVADEAYRRWYDCEMHGGGNGPGPLPMNQGHLQVHSPIPPSSWSILIDSETAEQESNLVATTP